MTFIKGQISLMKGKTKEAGLYPKNCGFQVGHGKYTSVGDFKKGEPSWNKGTATIIDCKCLECGKEFKINKCHTKRKNRGKYCSRECFIKAITIYEKSPGEKFIHYLRQLNEYKEWRMNCLKRDWFRCQECYTKENLEVHHIKSFTELIIEFLQEYNQFSPAEDWETLLRLATNYKLFWDINNGQTLCEKHHKSLTMKVRMDIKWQI